MATHGFIREQVGLPSTNRIVTRASVSETYHSLSPVPFSAIPAWHPANMLMWREILARETYTFNYTFTFVIFKPRIYNSLEARMRDSLATLVRLAAKFTHRAAEKL
jgi:hypothetical protein